MSSPEKYCSLASRNYFPPSDKRIETIETNYAKDKQWANDEHMSLANQVVESERRIIEKIDGNNKFSLNAILITVLAGIGWLVGIIGVFHPLGIGR